MCNVQRVMDCFFTWRATIATICNDERLEQTGIDSVALSGRLSDLIPGLKPWAISVGPFHGQRPWVWSPTYSVRTISWPRTTYRFRSPVGNGVIGSTGRFSMRGPARANRKPPTANRQLYSRSSHSRTEATVCFNVEVPAVRPIESKPSNQSACSSSTLSI